MKDIVILSGKGGTGKTSITASFAALAKNSVFVDCDVDAADLHLVLKPEVQEEHEFIGGKTAIIDQEKCAPCGVCMKLCRFDSISHEDGIYRVQEIGCEGCGVCAHFCPAEAIEMRDTVDGHWFVSQTRFGPMVHARLGIAAENSGKLVAAIRERARTIAKEAQADFIIVDGPPGIGCPVISSLTGAGTVLVVTEPSVSGIHDLERVIKLVAHFKIPMGILINKCDINPGKTAEIERIAEGMNIPVLAQVPYDSVFVKAQMAEKSVVEYENSPISDAIRSAWDILANDLIKRKK